MKEIKFQPRRFTTSGLILTCLGCSVILAGCGGSDASIDDGPPAPEIKPGSIPSAAGAPAIAPLPPVAPGVPAPAVPAAVAKAAGQVKATEPPPINPRVKITPPPPAFQGAPPPAVPRGVLSDPNR